MPELFVGLGIRLYARLLKQGFEIIPAQPELILNIRKSWRQKTRFLLKILGFGHDEYTPQPGFEFSVHPGRLGIKH
ncbi:hypothetical protein [Microcoleus sp. Pol7_B2]|uniref:hypothetical protein n=1 Tax=Microcoleus sp. Pol7_B2 TaxID=2818895 RepID=UPI002FD4EA0A